MNDTYTERMFNGSLEEIREMHGNGKSIEEIAERTNLSTYLVKALVERFVLEWDHYSDLPSPKAYEE